MQQIICTSISKKQLLRINYDNRGEREIEPYCLGYNKKRNILLRAYQIIGDSDSGESDGWKLFDLKKISNILQLPVVFAVRPQYNPNDSEMDLIICKI